MVRVLIATLVVFHSLSVIGVAQTCLHDGGESPEQQARRKLAISAARAINTLQHRTRRVENGDFKVTWTPTSFETMKQLSVLPSDQLPQIGSPAVPLSFASDSDLIPGWRLKLDVVTSTGPSPSSPGGYWFMIRDTTDPCGFAIVSNNDGVIFTSSPLR